MNEEKRWAIVADYKTSGSGVQTSRNLHVSRKVVFLWVKRYTSTNGVKELRKPGRKPASSVAAAERVVQL